MLYNFSQPRHFPLILFILIFSLALLLLRYELFFLTLLLIFRYFFIDFLEGVLFIFDVLIYLCSLVPPLLVVDPELLEVDLSFVEFSLYLLLLHIFFIEIFYHRFGELVVESLDLFFELAVSL